MALEEVEDAGEEEEGGSGLEADVQVLNGFAGAGEAREFGDVRAATVVETAGYLAVFESERGGVGGREERKGGDGEGR